MTGVRGRWAITAHLRCLTPLHIGAGTGSPGADRDVVRDGSGRLVIPGSTLAGALRAVAMTDGRGLEVWFGSADAGGLASRLWVEDAPAVEEPATPTEVRTRVGVSRRFGAVSVGALFALEAVATGTVFEVKLSVEDRVDLDQDGRDLVATVVHSLESGLALGAGRGVGQGRLASDWVTVTYMDLSTPAAWLDLLDGSSSSVHAVEIEDAPSATAPGEEATRIAWRPLGPVLVGRRMAHEHDADRVPEWREQGETACLVLPGSSVRGALRSHAELICRTVLGTDAPPPESGSHLSDVSVGGFPPLLRLFGGARPDRQGGRLVRGVALVHDVSSREFAADLWRRVIEAPRGECRRSLDALNQHLRESGTGLWLDLARRTSIDRWSGAGIGGALFASVEPYATSFDSWSPIAVDLRWPLAPQQHDLAALHLWRLIVDDLSGGWIRLGGGGTRGAGEIEVLGVESPLLERISHEDSGSAWRDAVSSWRTAAQGGER